MSGEFYDEFEGDLWGTQPVGSDGWEASDWPRHPQGTVKAMIENLQSQIDFLESKGLEVTELKDRQAELQVPLV